MFIDVPVPEPKPRWSIRFAVRLNIFNDLKFRFWVPLWLFTSDFSPPGPKPRRTGDPSHEGHEDGVIIIRCGGKKCDHPSHYRLRHVIKFNRNRLESIHRTGGKGFFLTIISRIIIGTCYSVRGGIYSMANRPDDIFVLLFSKIFPSNSRQP